MERTGWQRWAALGGVAFVVLNGAVGVAGGEPPAMGAPAAETAAYFADHAAALEAGVWLFGLAAVALIWWVSALWPWMVRAEGGTARLAASSMLGLAIAGSLSFASSAVWAAGALQAGALGSSAPVVNAVGWVFQVAGGFALAAHLLATTGLGWRARSLPRWIVAAGVVSAVAFLAAGVLGSTSTGGSSDTVGLLAYLLFSVWVLGLSHVLWRDAAVRPATASGDRRAATTA